MTWTLALLLLAQTTTHFERSDAAAVWKYSDGSLAVVVAKDREARPLVTRACGGPCSVQKVGEVWYQGDTIPELTATPLRFSHGGMGIWDFGAGRVLAIVPPGKIGERLLDSICQDPCRMRYLGDLWFAETLPLPSVKQPQRGASRPRLD